MGEAFSVLDLFCGAGGLALGFRNAGFDLACAVDIEPAAIATYRANIGDHVRSADLNCDSELPDTDVIAGGPPCQGFSSAGMRMQGDRRNSLVTKYAELIAKKRPAAFVFENVEGFLTTDDGTAVFELLTPLIAAGYRIHLRKVNAANYGVPQHRKRVIGIGALGWDPPFPLPSHTAYGAPGALLASRHLPLTPSIRDALAGLPPAARTLPGEPQGHFARPLDGDDLVRALALRQGMTMRDLPEEFQHASYRRRANRRVKDGTPTERRGGAPSGIRRLRGDEPSKAITGGARSEFLHPDEHRNLTLRECARLQTFPDDFVFCGSQSEQMQLIGNAVPPAFATVIARTLLDSLRVPHLAVEGGALLSFVPTLSDGSSPALRRVTDQVMHDFGSNITDRALSLWA
jgi:DNA (cytosine-5)-methyltransferase 1